MYGGCVLSGHGLLVASYKNQKVELSGYILIKGNEIQLELAGISS